VTVGISNSCNQDSAVSEEIKEPQKPSVNETHARVNKAAQQELRQLNVEEQGDLDVITIEDDDSEQSR